MDVQGNNKTGLGKSLSDILKKEDQTLKTSGSLFDHSINLKMEDVMRHIKKDGTDKAVKIRAKETRKVVKNFQARLMSEEEGPRLLDLIDMTQRGLEFLIDCFDNLQNEKIINENFLIHDAQKEFLGMQKAFFPKAGFTEEKDLIRIENQKKIDFILSEISRMDKEQLNRIYLLMKKGFNHGNQKK